MFEVSDTISDYGVITGILIQDPTMAKNEFRSLCTMEYEELFLWCSDRNDQCHLCSKPTKAVFQAPYWKTAAALLRLSLGYAHNFETIEMSAAFNYLWLKSFDTNPGLHPSFEPEALSTNDTIQLHSGLCISLQNFEKLLCLMQLLNKDEKLYTSLSLLYSSLEQHFCCILCETSLTGRYHEHQAEDLPIWQHVIEIPKLEMAVIQACRAAEAILGEPPNHKEQTKVNKFVHRWIDAIGWNPHQTYKKADKTYLDFYYELFFLLRNPSAHSRGDIHYTLARTRTVTAQCFAFQVFESYLKKVKDNL